MSTVGERNPAGKGETRANRMTGGKAAREPMILLLELRATVSQLLREAGAAQDKQQEPSSSKSQPGKCQCRLSVDCVAEMTRLPLWRDPRNSFNLTGWRRVRHTLKGTRAGVEILERLYNYGGRPLRGLWGTRSDERAVSLNLKDRRLRPRVPHYTMRSYVHRGYGG